METRAPYIANPVDQNGYVKYSEEENKVWQALMQRQMPLLQNRACDEYLQGLELLNLPYDRIPQCEELNTILQSRTGWRLEPVPALIPTQQFFKLLANKQFPLATFIRRFDDIDYIQEPDIFHEIVGHCPLLLHPVYADFVHTYGKLSLEAEPRIQKLLSKLFCFTIEVGLIKTSAGLRIYGGGILSSKNECIYALESPIPERRPFDISLILKTPYSINVMQKIYYVIDDFSRLYSLIETDLVSELNI